MIVVKATYLRYRSATRFHVWKTTLTKTVQFVSFGNLYLRTNQLLYRQSKCLTRVATVSKDFLYRTKIIPVTFRGWQAAFSIRNIRRRHRRSMRQILRVNRYSLIANKE